MLAAEGSKPLGPEEPRLERVGEYHLLRLGQREYRVGGLDKNNSLEVLKIALRLRHGEDFHLDSFDMARDGERRRFIERAAEETRLEKDLIKRDLGRLLLLLEEAQTERIRAALEPAEGSRATEMTAEERQEALAFLKSPHLVERIAEAFTACGLVGEETNRLAAYLACTSRKLEKPLAVIIQSTSAAGKSDAHGSGARDVPGGGARQVQRDDGPEPLLPRARRTSSTRSWRSSRRRAPRRPATP